MFLAKDFIETAEGLIFAVVESGLEQDKVLCFLRYIFKKNQWEKLNTIEANAILSKQYPQYLYYSPVKEAKLHAVIPDKIIRHHQPGIKLKEILSSQSDLQINKDLIKICQLYNDNGLDLDYIGVTGSLLINAQHSNSDIDLVFYSRDVFFLARQVTQKLIQEDKCYELSQKDWEESYDRRNCDLSLSEYIWHEKRKFNKAIINRRKFDLSLVDELPKERSLIQYKKLAAILIKALVINDSSSFDYPAEFLIEHQQIKSIVSYTATYNGQAKTGEWVEVSGILEESKEGIKRIVVGSTREAKGEYIKVIHE